MTSNNPSVSIVLLNYNSFEDTKECILSLNDCTYDNFDIWVVDNASKDDSLAKLKALFGDLKFIASEINLGFSGGCNLGTKAALKEGADYILLLNNDTVVDSEFLKELVKTGEAHPKVGMIGGKIYFFHDKKMLWDAGGEIDLISGRGKRAGGGTIDTGQYDEERAVSFVTGCMMLIKREVMESVGLLPECYFFGVEEWDYSVAVKKAGYELRYNPKAVIWHKVGGAHSDLDPVFYYNFLRNRLLFMKRNAPGWWFPIWYSYFSFYTKYIKLKRHKAVFKNAEDLKIATNAAFSEQTGKKPVVKADLDRLRKKLL
jgi:GT2 family glycosyltransferase